MQARRVFQVLITACLVQFVQGCGTTSVKKDRLDFVQIDNTPTQRALLLQYRDWRGTPYKLGGNSRSGIDCSAFVQQTLSTHFNVSVPRTTGEQVKVGSEVSRSEPRVGDLVFFRTGASSRHVGIYVGSRHFLHASTTVGVTLGNLDDTYWRKTFWTIRRVL